MGYNAIFAKAYRFGIFSRTISCYPQLIPYLILTVLPIFAASLFLLLRLTDFPELSLLRVFSPTVVWTLVVIMQATKRNVSQTLVSAGIILPIEFFILLAALQLDKIIQISWWLVNAPLFFWLCGILSSLRPHIGNFSLWITVLGLMLAFNLMSVATVTEAVTINWRFAFTPIWCIESLAIRPDMLLSFMVRSRSL